MFLGTGFPPRSPVRKDCQVSLPASGSTPKTRICGRRCFAATAQPASSPLPLVGTSRKSSSGTSSSISRAAVAFSPLISESSQSGDERHSALAADSFPCLFAVLTVAVVKDHLGAVRAGRRDFDLRRVLRHHDYRRRSEEPRGQRRGLRVISRRVSQDAASAVVLAERGEFVVRAPEFERAGALQVFGFEEYLASRALVELFRRQDRRAVRHALQPLPGLYDVVKSQP